MTSAQATATEKFFLNWSNSEGFTDSEINGINVQISAAAAEYFESGGDWDSEEFQQYMKNATDRILDNF